MFNLIRLTGYFLIVIVVAATAVVLQPEWARDLSLQDWTLENWRTADQQRSAELDEMNQVKQQQYPVKCRAVQRVIDGRATLFEVAAVFLQLNRETGASTFQPPLPGCSEEEWACRQVIVWVSTYGIEGHACLARVLEGELRQHKEQYGAVILPAVGTVI